MAIWPSKLNSARKNKTKTHGRLTTLSSLFLSSSLIYLHECFSPGTFIANFIKYQFLTRYFYKFRAGVIPSWSIWSGRDPQGFSITQHEHCGEQENLLSRGGESAISVEWCCLAPGLHRLGVHRPREDVSTLLWESKRGQGSAVFTLLAWNIWGIYQEVNAA